MNKREVTEIKRRFKKEACTISKMVGCYVDSGKQKVVTFRESFLNLEEEEFHKYLEIVNKSLSGKLGNNLVELEFPTETEINGGPQQSLMALRASHLDDDAMLESFYDHVIETYDYVGNYLILLFYDNYDVPLKTTDQLGLDESEEVYEYIICAICPVALSKPGLGYNEEENSISKLERDWVVGATDTAFLFPAFNDRSSDIHATLCYAKNPKEPHKEFWENGLGCASKYTSVEKQTAFDTMVMKAVNAYDEEDAEDVLIDVQTALNLYIEEETPLHEKDDPIILQANDIVPILTDGGVSEDKAEHIKKEYEEFFHDEMPEAEELLNAKILKDNESRVEKKILEEKVVELTDKLEEAGLLNDNGKDVDIVVRVSEEKLDQISTAFVDGQRCIVIPLLEDDATTINGEPARF